jgi:hypothetical protein
VRDLFEDLRDGHNLLSLLEVLSGEILVSHSIIFIFGDKPSKLLTSTMTPNFDRWSQRIKKIVGASRPKKDPLFLKL